MAFNLETGHILAKISGGLLHGQLLRVTPEKYDGSAKTFNYLALPDGEFVPTVDTQRERDTYYVCGCSGSGKSYFSKQYAKEYERNHKDNQIYLFSKVGDDPSLKGIKFKRVKLQNINAMYKAQQFIKDFGPNSLVVYDDVDTIKDKDIKACLAHIKDEIQEMGRHHNTSILSLTHLGTRGNDSRRDLSESMVVVVFPQSLTGSNERMLKSYCGLSNKEIDKIKRSIKSRWVALHRHVYPPAWVSQKEVGLLSYLEMYSSPLSMLTAPADSDSKSMKCGCGGVVSKNNETRHNNTARHTKYMEELKKQAYGDLQHTIG